ncbi:MAG: site-specific integrase [Methylobacterium sp.]|nr:site-specific integrase [Methylobacterium sp.]MCA3637802.1 site-specific integrase [Methylobacterium sp.]
MGARLGVESSGSDGEKGVTATAIRKLLSAGKPGVIRDDRLPGFCARLNGDGSISFLLEYRAGRGRAFPVRRIVIAKVEQDGKGGIVRGAMSIAEARARAEDLKAKARDERAPIDERDPMEARRKDAAALAAERAAPTVEELLKAFIKDEIAPKRRPRTAELYAGYIPHLVAEIGNIKVKELSRSKVRAAHVAIGAKRRVTANRCITFLKSAINWAIAEERLPKRFDNPAMGVKYFEEEGRERFLSEAELTRLGEALALAETDGIPHEIDEMKPVSKHAAKPENRREKFDAHAVAAIRLLALTGLRLREVLHLRWTEVDIERGFLTLAHTKTKRRIVPLGAPALSVLAGLERIGTYVIASTSAGTKDERPRHDLKRPWTAVTRHAGLAGLRIHDLRHTAASVGAGSGLGLVVIGGLLGHKNARTTARYAHIADTPLRAAADTVSGRIAEHMGLLKNVPKAEVIPLKGRKK